MGSQAETIDIDAELEEWLDKEAATQGVSLDDPYADELGMIMDWREDPSQENFTKLYQAHQPLIFAAGRQYYQSAQLPKTAVASKMMQQYVQALETYDPNKGAAFNTHVYNTMRRTGRWVQTYANVGRIPENRAWLIDTLERRERHLEDKLGRPPSDRELSDDVLIAIKDIPELRHRRVAPNMVSTLRKELRKDWMAESRVEPTAAFEEGDLRRHIVFLHGSLNPQQQLILEHTFEGFGKPIIEDAKALGDTLNMSEQKVRALRRQIQRKVDRYYRRTKRL